MRSPAVLKPALLLLALLVVYRPALDGAFLWDDHDNLTKSRPLHEPGGLRRIWLEPGATQQYFPVLHTLWWGETRLFGDDPRGYHVVNLLLHFTACVLLARVVARLGLPAPWFAAALFALHPICVESVAWITEGKNTLSLCFALASLAAYLRYEGFPTTTNVPRPAASGGDASDVHVLDSGVSSRAVVAVAAMPRPGVAWYVASLALFAAAVLGKTNAVVLPGVILVLLAWRRGRISRGDVLRMLPMVAIGAAVATIVVHVERNLLGAGKAEFDWPWIERIVVAGRACWFYLGKILWPHPLTFIYPRWQIDPQDVTQRLYPLAAIALPLLLWSQRKRLGAAPLAAVLLFGGTLLPQLGLLPIYGQIFSYVADHWTYLSAVPVVVFVAAGLAYFAERRLPRGVAQAGAVALLGLLAFLTWRQTSIYRDEVALWTDTLAKNPDCWLAHNNLALKQIEAENYVAADAHLSRALELRPDFKEAYANRGLILLNQNRRREAAAEFRRALEIDPRFAPAHMYLAMLLADENSYAEAIEHLRSALEREADFPQARATLGLLLARTGRTEEGLHELQTAVARDQRDAKAYVNLGTVLAGLGRHAEARAALQQALAIDPRQAAAHATLGNLLLAGGDAVAAEAAYLESLTLDADEPDVHFNLGNTLVRLKQPDAAIDAYRRALELKPDHVSANLNLAAVLIARGRRDEARTLLEALVARHPDNEPAARMLRPLRAAGESRS